MAFDQATRNRLARFVDKARALLSEEFTRQLQLEYGLDPASGERAPIEKLAHLDDARRATALVLRDTLDHYLAAAPGKGPKATQEALQRIVREQAFTLLNRLCALRLAEARGIMIESVAQGYQSRGFQLYGRLAGTALGETGDAYRAYLLSLFDELAVDLPALFDRFAPEGGLFPHEPALLDLLALLNHSDLAELWVADETIGWVYQYFNSKEERQAMRAESQAPRNSRELAVRNQFFTPRYVVEFLADNTLGRTWYEMTRGQTGLVDSCRYLVRRPNEVFLRPGEQAPAQVEPAEGLSQEELLQQPVHIPHRQLKDPRAILMLDPACGSMHFGLYAFDLFEQIYAEAWELEAERAPLDAPLHEAYPDKEAFLRDVPRLIVERNIHGVDIDPRAAQIAALALWLRAQRSWREQGVKAQERPVIRRSNVVCAEPMPGDPAMLDEFIAHHLSGGAEDRVVGQMLRRVFKAMELAGEAGSLLKIEEEIRSIIAEGKRSALAGPRYDQTSLFGDALRPRQGHLNIDASGITDETFWQRAEERVYEALAAYASFADGSATGFYRRRLFADDAKQGFAFIDLCRKLYDVVLMNPPFGEPSYNSLNYLNSEYINWNNNLLCAFIERGWHMSGAHGFVGIIYDRTAVVKSTYEDFRRNTLVKDNRISTMADLGWEVLDANVEVTTTVLRHIEMVGSRVFLDLRGTPPSEKSNKLINQLGHVASSKQEDSVYLGSGLDFLRLPNAVLGYDFPKFLQKAFFENTSLESVGFKAYQGHALKADKHFRLWWEVSLRQNIVMHRLFNGSEYSPYQTSLLDCVISPCPIHKLPKDTATVLRNTSLHGITGVCFGKRGEYFSSHILPADHIFTVEGQSIPLGNTRKGEIYELLGFLNTPLVRSSLNKYCGQHKYSGYVNLMPYKKLSDVATVAGAVRDVITKGLIARTIDEIQSFFYPQLEALSLKVIASRICSSVNSYIRAIIECEELCHQATLEAFHVSPKERETLESLRAHQPRPASPVEDVLPSDNCLIYSAHYLLSIAIGLIVGRWDIRYATGEKPTPELPDPFAPLPVCPPGMLQNERGLPAAPEDVPASYPLRISWPGILVDDEGHAEDIVGRAREAIRVIWGARAEALEQEACEIIGVKSLRDYFTKPAGFFADHLARYSKSRRQAPIYWPLATPSGSYTLWLYYHRLSDQTLYSCVNDFVEPKLKMVSEQLSALSQKAGRSAKEEKELERLDGLRKELISFRDELLRVAAFWKPNLNDGVQITAAPLWRLFQLKPWQKRLKETWERLEQGEYDWAHLAYSIWPERVREKCKDDKSLAIAHDLEALYVAPPASAGKKGRGRGKKAAVDEEGGLDEE